MVFAQQRLQAGNSIGDIRDTEEGIGLHSKDTTSQKKDFPRGLYVWTIDRKFGDIRPCEPDTLPHLYPQSTLATGRHMEYNTTGSNYSARQNRIFIDRKDKQQFVFTQAYDEIHRNPNEYHFTNTLSPITNLSYDNCGDKTNGEDHIDARFAANVGKRFGAGMDLDYAYARGYFQNQSISHFGATFHASYLGDYYQMHTLFSTYHEKTTENGGITNDDYITHPELFTESYTSNEIPTILQSNWNRNDNNHLFLSHRYNVGFFREVVLPNENKTDTLVNDSLKNNIKHEFVPVTSFIHTLDLEDYDRHYLAYNTPDSYYADSYFSHYDNGYGGDSIDDRTRYFGMRNTLAIALLEGFNKYLPAGLKVFATHELRRIKLPALDNSGLAQLTNTNENTISVGGQLRKAQGHTLHYNLTGETWLVGEDAGQIKLNGETDLNFAFLGDTVRLMAKAHFYRIHPTFYERHYHAKHFWWDNTLDKETRTHVEGTFAYEKTKTKLRFAIEEIQNYTYYGMAYTRADDKNTLLSAGVRQHGGNINILTAQLDQQLNLGPLHWDNLITYQHTSNADVIPLPTINVFSNLYLKFMVAGVLRVELGASATWFSKYYAPDFCPAINQFAVQENEDTRVELGNFPFVDVYANLHLKHARFFLMMQNATASSFNRKYFLAPHYPMNASVLHFGVSWNFFN